MQRRDAIARGIAFLTLGTMQISTAFSDDTPMRPRAIKWQPMPREWADGPEPLPRANRPPEVAVIWGDPSKEGAPFIFWMRPAEHGATVPVPPHWHPTDEHLTVLSGVFRIAAGDKYDEAACEDLPEGSSILIPKSKHHFGVSKNATIQISGTGPFKIDWIR